MNDLLGRGAAALSTLSTKQPPIIGQARAMDSLLDRTARLACESVEPEYPHSWQAWFNQAESDLTALLQQYIGASQPWATLWRTAAANANDGDAFHFYPVLEEGQYTLMMWGMRAATRGKIDTYLDDVLVDSARDWYKATDEYGTQVSFDLDVTNSGLHNLDLIVNGKSGSDYTVGITIILIYPRAE